MVVGAFPAAKLGALLLKQISKPIANIVKEQAKSSPVFRKYVCMPPAQFYNWCEVKSKMWILNLGKPVNIPVLSEAMAIELGANLLGEGIIFVIAAAILISEYNRSARKEAAKEEMKKQEMKQIQDSIRELYIQSEELSAHIREITRKIGYLDQTNYRRPNIKYVENVGIMVYLLNTDVQNILRNPKPPITPNPSQPKKTTENLPSEGDLIQEMSYIHEVHPCTLRPTNLIFQAVNNVKDQFWSGSG